MNAHGRNADPIERHIVALAATLHGPAKAKARMIEELHDGLTDTAEAIADEDVPYARAAERAVREFGTLDELVPSCQRELTIAQARHTARTVALTTPFLIACWHLARTTDHEATWQLPYVAQALAVHLAAVATVAALLSAGTLAATGTLARRLPTPHQLPFLVACAGTAAGVAMAVTTLALATASALATNWTLLAFAGTLAAASHAPIASSARACRRCARLPLARHAVSQPGGAPDVGL
ncbi:permease prefix domain 1-containing protein [Streptomyces sp. NPDC048560]|uniref:permease prefix domain 1-containing protein n=1 Tax=Streptomyces sp. NPDC048560 TaxID=3155488 RepID=UPI0034246257